MLVLVGLLLDRVEGEQSCPAIMGFCRHIDVDFS
jgi:hypothetical protein